MGCGTSKPRQIPRISSDPYDGSQLVPGVLHTWGRENGAKVAPVLGQLTVVSIDVGSEASHLAITRGGDLYVWPKNGDVASAKLIQRHVRSAAIGSDHIVSAAENDSGIVTTYTWSLSSAAFEWLGHGDSEEAAAAAAVTEPKAVKGLNGKDVVEVFASANTTAALTRTGELYMWGSNEYGECGSGDAEPVREPKLVGFELDGRQVVSVGLGEHHSICTCYDGTSWGWGSNAWNQLGLGINHFGQDQPLPVQIAALGDETIASIACGRNHSVALTDKARVFTWGCNEDNQLGLPEGPDPERMHCPEPVLTPEIAKKECIRIVAGPSLTAALSVDGECIAWGAFPEATVPIGRRPHLVPEISTVVAVAMGENSGLFLKWDEKWA